MKKFFGYIFFIIINYLLISLIVFPFSYLSLTNNKTYDIMWVKYIQKKLYFGGLRNIWNTNKKCSKFDKSLLYVPVVGECDFSNAEFNTKMNFDEHRRLNMRDDNILENEKIIAAIGDSMTMGWGVNDDETFSYNLQKLLGKKVINLGVSSYGTIREIKKLKSSKFYNQIDTILVQYHLNDIYENKELDINKSYSLEEYDAFFNSSKNEKYSVFLLKNYKKSLRLLFTHLKDLFFPRKEIHNIDEHLDILEKLLIENLGQENKRIYVFIINDPHKSYVYSKNRKFKNFQFEIIQIKKDHLFIIDDHLNRNGHKFVGNKLFDSLRG